MRRIRVIPLLMIDNGKAVVTRGFKNPVYVGDPINAIKIFNDKEVDELIILDISDQKRNKTPDFNLIKDMASESFMPIAYGGHVNTVADAERVINSGIEKISFNTALFHNSEVVQTIAYRFGSQSVVASIDIEKNFFGKYVVKTRGGKELIKGGLDDILKRVVSLGVGEILLNFINNDGSLKGYDKHLLSQCTKCIRVPLVACGGASKVEDFVEAVKEGKASAVAAGAMFYFKGSFNSVLINYPDQQELSQKFYNQFD